MLAQLGWRPLVADLAALDDGDAVGELGGEAKVLLGDEDPDDLRAMGCTV